MGQKKPSRTVLLAALLVGLVFAGGCGGTVRPGAQDQAARPAQPDGVLARTRAFEFHGGFWSDLHHFLYVVARSRLKTPDSRRAAVVHAPEELQKAEISAVERQAIDDAIAVYGRSFAARDLVFDDVAARQSWAVAQLESGPSTANKGVDPELTQALELAAPAWRREFWPRHSLRNRAWLDEVLPILSRHSDGMVRGIENAYAVRWPADRQRVELVAYANWAGAYTVEKPPRTTMSTTDPSFAGTAALEMLFHEASHTFDGHIEKLLAEEGKRQGRNVPPRLPHAIVFDTAGELVTERVPGYVVAGERAGVFARGDWFREPLTRIWHPHLAGRASLADALRDLIAAVGTQ